MLRWSGRESLQSDNPVLTQSHSQFNILHNILYFRFPNSHDMTDDNVKVFKTGFCVAVVTVMDTTITEEAVAAVLQQQQHVAEQLRICCLDFIINFI